MEFLVHGLLSNNEEKIIHIANKKIHALYHPSDKLPSLNTYTFDDSHRIFPGLIDMHIHGTHGADVMDADIESLQLIANKLLTQGTTGFLATTMTADSKTLEQVLEVLAKFQQQQTYGAKLLGIHLEGPFIAKEFMGAQKPDHVIEPNIALFDHWQMKANNLIKMVTLAPEQPNGISLVQHLKKKNIISSLGHSASNYDIAQQAIDAGITHATHLFNAMRQLHHREPGAITALLLRKEVYAELIADGFHLNNAILQLAYQLKNSDKIILVTDAMRAQCLHGGIYDLGGQDVHVENHTARLKNGTLAGSIITLPEAIKKMMEATSCTFFDIEKMASKNPAIQLKLAHKGSIEKNSDADMVIFDQQFNVKKVIINGEIIE
jgi:N-acetylglucosamine-6-phosphate deacetylase